MSPPLPASQFGTWIETSIHVPDTPLEFPYVDHVSCLCVLKGEYDGRQMRLLLWNAFKQSWDDSMGDDWFCDKDDVTHWMPAPDFP